MDNNQSTPEVNTENTVPVKTKKTKKQIVSLVLNIVIWVFVAFAIFVTIVIFASFGSKDGIPSFGKTMWVSVQSDSMKGIFNKGDLIFCEKLTDEEKTTLKVGDIITFRQNLDKSADGSEELNTHRILSYDAASGRYQTKGDANNDQDDYTVHYTKIVAKYTEKRIVGLGGIIDFLNTKIGFGVFVVLPVLALFVYYLVTFIMLVKPKKKLSAAEEDEIKRLAVEEYLRQQKAAEAEKTPDSEPVSNTVSQNTPAEPDKTSGEDKPE